MYVGSVLVKKLNFSTIAYAAQMEDTDEGVSQLAKQLNETDLVAGEYEGEYVIINGWIYLIWKGIRWI